MPRLRIEMNRDGTKSAPVWVVRAEGDAGVTVEQAIAQLPAYCSKYQHRMFFDGRLMAEVKAPRYLRSKIIRHA